VKELQKIIELPPAGSSRAHKLHIMLISSYVYLQLPMIATPSSASQPLTVIMELER
jgi:hypothetical protein